jgi:hypothetical protein
MPLNLYYPVKNPIDQNNLFGTTSPMYTSMGQIGHPGVDFEAPLDTTFYSPCDGEAFYVTDKDGGDGLWIRWPNNISPQYDIILWHLPPAADPTYHPLISLPKPGQNSPVVPITAGQDLGWTGNSGYPLESTGPHLHVGVIPLDSSFSPMYPDNGYEGCVDPMPFFNGLYAEDINKIQPIVDAIATIVPEVVSSSLPIQVQLSFLQKVAQFLSNLFQRQ